VQEGDESPGPGALMALAVLVIGLAIVERRQQR